MGKFSKAVTCAIILSGSAMAVSAQPAATPPPPPPPFILTSSGFQDGGIIPDKFTQASATPISPALSWINPPAGTISYALILHDPDAAPRKMTADVLHWLAFNIPGSTTSLPENVPTTPTLADGTVQPVNTSGKPGFMGPGSRGVYHHYTFELFALDTKLTLGPDATRDQVNEAMNGHILGKAVVEGRFHR